MNNGETVVYLGLGSNLGGRADMLQHAIIYLAEQPEIKVLRCSGVYETSPWGELSQPDFLNCVLEARTTLNASVLLHRLKETEQRLGRKTASRYGPRSIDIDILLYGNHIVDTDNLQIPHPKIEERNFILIPLNELAPSLLYPRNGHCISDLLRESTDNGTVVSTNFRLYVPTLNSESMLG